ncbi:Lipid A core - O-antigen ligase [Aurantiacibacter gangjinensis]|uniref:O-antigen ligase-related domain-containing protein n=1 Tax=Aurantiacibacter gangjinensis TaxID=502682 RepID=A0A0G9ML52_9SPHN|nr:Lipid A core - O-antigen ligase [Aurantiacibacter gangjinensis]KLE31420.1 hypothetical protein AAW01_07435 [Aurantiacibacter gangjinensis]
MQVLIVTAVLLGGGGSNYPLRNLAVQLLALAILALHRARVFGFIASAPRALLWLVVATIALPLLQLVSLPPVLWQELPGRDLIATSLSIAGIGADVWMPFSLDPMRTLIAFGALVVPVTVLSVGATLPTGGRYALMRCIIGCALGAVLLGAVQLASGTSAGILFDDQIDRSVLYGTFANRNSTALFFVLALVMLAALPVARTGPGRLMTAAACAMLVFGSVLTQSRSGMVLLGVVLAVIAIRAIVRARSSDDESSARFGKPWIAASGVAGLLAIALAASAMTGGRVADALDRFGVVQTDRLEMWEDTAFAAGQFAPVGAGMGAFNDTFQVTESLEYVSQRRAGRAHNDYLELALEAGVPGLALALLWLVWATIAALRKREWQGFAAALGIACIAAQSLLDYPLRAQTLLCISAILALMLLTASREEAV